MLKLLPGGPRWLAGAEFSLALAGGSSRSSPLCCSARFCSLRLQLTLSQLKGNRRVSNRANRHRVRTGNRVKTEETGNRAARRETGSRVKTGNRVKTAETGNRAALKETGSRVKTGNRVKTAETDSSKAAQEATGNRVARAETGSKAAQREVAIQATREDKATQATGITSKVRVAEMSSRATQAMATTSKVKAATTPPRHLLLPKELNPTHLQPSSSPLATLLPRLRGSLSGRTALCR